MPPSGDEGAKPPPGEAAAAGGGGGGCPFAGGAATTTATASTCPVAPAAANANAAASAAAAAAAATAPQPPPAVCPFGFGAGGAGKGGAASTPLHCPLCRSLLFDCHAAKPCGHKACRECLSRFRDCPICGADVETSEPDAGAQGMVDAFLGAHGVYPDAVAAALDVGPLMQDLLALSGGGGGGEGDGAAKSGGGGEAALTAALLQGVALRSYAGGNVSAALARFEAAREALLRVLEEEEGEEAGGRASGSKAALALGVVLGGIGDCRRRQDDHPAAEASYRASAERLAAAAGVVVDLDAEEELIVAPTAAVATEAAQALGVTLNKWGDLCYSRVAGGTGDGSAGDGGGADAALAAALRLYRRTLTLRSARLEALREQKEQPGAEPEAAGALADARLELAAALIKVGDAAARLSAGAGAPASEDPAALFARARALLAELGGQEEGEGQPPRSPLDRARAAKRERLVDALVAVGGLDAAEAAAEICSK